jgi:glycosyltransferase involved in cell wall biosynthesis
MRVLMVTPSYYPITGGAETLIRNLSIKLDNSGIHTDILTFNMLKKWEPQLESKREKLDNLTIYKIPGFNWFPTVHSDRITFGINLIPLKFRKIFNEYDIIHFHVGDLSLPFFSLDMQKPKIAHFHGPLDFYKKSYPSRKILLNMATIYVSISHEMYQALIDIGVPQNKIRYVPNGVDCNVFTPSGDKQKNLVLFVGRITSDKGLHILLKSLNTLKTKIELVIIGPPQWDTDYFKEIQNQIQKENTRGFHKITYLGWQPQNVIVEWCQKASLFVLPSFKEACGIAVLEALACETAVVATDIEGIREVVFNGVNGLLVPTNDSVKLTFAMQYLLDNESVLNKFGKEGRKIVKTSFSYDSAIKEFHQIYKEMAL